ncbi:hypothetical protein [Parachryseolinea silvisoli]|jgi:hypothetical protein|uniref:hypothetical protein n=1 Tax=Parachryseolinea silvisoli TaxID=2873601 RepID=UPI002265D75B|nr:hypothetical protein [Parachryseolinea silvisoli]MCD9018477.1 hypothetical protein [Parachryseolinea silvisoli]
MNPTRDSGTKHTTDTLEQKLQKKKAQLRLAQTRLKAARQKLRKLKAIVFYQRQRILELYREKNTTDDK